MLTKTFSLPSGGYNDIYTYIGIIEFVKMNLIILKNLVEKIVKISANCCASAHGWALVGLNYVTPVPAAEEIYSYFIRINPVFFSLCVSRALHRLIADW